MKKRNLKIMDIILITLLLFQVIVPINVFAEDEPYKIALNKIKSQNYPEYIYVNGNEYVFNYDIYSDPYYFEKVIYGTPEDLLPNNEKKYSDKTGRDEWRYLGYNKDKRKVTNKEFPNEVSTDGSPTGWNITTGTFVYQSEAQQSWNNLSIKNSSLYDYNRNHAVLIGHGLTEADGITASHFGSTNKTELLTYASIFSGGSIKIEHTENGSVRYATFDMDPMEKDGLVKVDFQPDRSLYTIESTENDVDVKVHAELDISPTSPYFTTDMIEKSILKVVGYKIDDGNVISCGDDIKADVTNDYSLDLKGTINFDRDSLGGVGTHKIEFILNADIDFSTQEKLGQEEICFTEIAVEENNAPTAQINVDGKSYVGTSGNRINVFKGDRINIVGEGSDKEQNASQLTYEWVASNSSLKSNLSENYSSGIGGIHVFSSTGDYTLELIVTDNTDKSANAKVTFHVLDPEQATLDLQADNTPKKCKIIKNNNFNIDINATGTIVNNRKEISRLDLIVVQAPKGHTEGEYIPVVNPQVECRVGNYNSISNSFRFDIDTEGDEYTQYFKVMFVANYVDGTNEFTEQILKTIFTKQDFEEVDDNKRPKVVVVANPHEVKAGDNVRVRGNADDEDGSIEVYDWYSVPGQDMVGSISGSSSNVWFKWSNADKGIDEKPYTFKLRVYDNGGKSASSSDSIVVLPPTVEAALNCDGTFKENRLITISAENSISSTHYPITNYNWTITALGNGADVNSIRYDGELAGSISKDILFKKAGRYKIRVNVSNEFGYSDSTYKILDIKEDIPPICSFDFVKTILREPTDSNYATFRLEDNSVSIDNDRVAKRVWLYSYNSDNDSSYSDEVYYVFENGRWRVLNSFNELDTINDGNRTTVTLRTNKVGRYNFELYVKEEFGQPTIQKFITSSDKKSSKSF